MLCGIALSTTSVAVVYAVMLETGFNKTEFGKGILGACFINVTFGTISAIFGLTHNIVTQAQYSFLVATVIASAVIPTLIAGLAFLPRHLLLATNGQPEVKDDEGTLSDEG